ncbi:hypothetical protein BA723_00270 [Helicobacter sp. CLO-3]|nr:hypothetical protein BA723_00270 [Helicobacter sp. CLO-3]
MYFYVCLVFGCFFKHCIKILIKVLPNFSFSYFRQQCVIFCADFFNIFDIMADYFCYFDGYIARFGSVSKP